MRPLRPPRTSSIIMSTLGRREVCGRSKLLHQRHHRGTATLVRPAFPSHRRTCQSVRQERKTAAGGELQCSGAIDLGIEPAAGVRGASLDRELHRGVFPVRSAIDRTCSPPRPHKSTPDTLTQRNRRASCAPALRCSTVGTRWVAGKICSGRTTCLRPDRSAPRPQ